VTRANNTASEAPELYLPALARAAADRRRKPRKPLTRSEALADAPWDDSMPAGWKRAFQQAYADRLEERGLAVPAATSGPSGETTLPRIKVSLAVDELADVGRAAERAGLPVATWARRELVRSARRGMRT
jgi:hypothetical protein